MRYRKVLFIFLALVAFPVRAPAWGYEAHRVIAEIAEQFLAPQTAHRVRELLAIENLATLADVSIWADEIRLQHPETGPWHYVNIPLTLRTGEPAVYDALRDCPQGDCVVAKIEQFEHVLSDQEVPERQRLEALKYIVHFVGDAHQPLHVSNDHDRGGNDVPVVFLGLRTNLHAVWDSGIITPAVKGNERAYALQLVQSISEEQRQHWSEGTLISWVNEGHEIAARTIYGELPHSGTLPDDYETKALPIVNKQLERAGARLAMVLNTVLNEKLHARGRLCEPGYMSLSTQLIADLAGGVAYPFSDWLNSAVPTFGAGVYTIWHKDGRFIYVGMSGRGITADTNHRNTPQGIYTRLQSHASGRRSGDQFCVYVADRQKTSRLLPQAVIRWMLSFVGTSTKTSSIALF
jgi:hypothetical protein